jgi:hypothetical protein
VDRRLDSVQMISDFMSESSFPEAQTRSLSFENKSISFYPNTICEIINISMKKEWGEASLAMINF